jgi:hypothetical protein
MQTSGDQRRENAKLYLRRMGRAKRNPSPSVPALMGIASLHPSYGIGIAAPYQPSNFAIEAMSTFKFLVPLRRSMVHPNYPRNRRGN